MSVTIGPNDKVNRNSFNVEDATSRKRESDRLNRKSTYGTEIEGGFLGGLLGAGIAGLVLAAGVTVAALPFLPIIFGGAALAGAVVGAAAGFIGRKREEGQLGTRFFEGENNRALDARGQDARQYSGNQYDIDAKGFGAGVPPVVIGGGTPPPQHQQAYPPFAPYPMGNPVPYHQGQCGGAPGPFTKQVTDESAKAEQQQRCAG